MYVGQTVYKVNSKHVRVTPICLTANAAMKNMSRLVTTANSGVWSTLHPFNFPLSSFKFGKIILFHSFRENLKHILYHFVPVLHLLYDVSTPDSRLHVFYGWTNFIKWKYSRRVHHFKHILPKFRHILYLRKLGLSSAWNKQNKWYTCLILQLNENRLLF